MSGLRKLCKIRTFFIILYFCFFIFLFSWSNFVQENQMESIKSKLINISGLLKELDRIILKTESEVRNNKHGNIYKQDDTQQLESYISTLQDFSKKYSFKSICEIGFAGGQSAMMFLYSTQSSITYTVFDIWGEIEHGNTAIKWILNKFPNGRLNIIKGDPTKTLPRFKGTCDVIHINSAYREDYSYKANWTSIKRIASSHNLLFINDCGLLWSQVESAVKSNILHGIRRYNISIPKHLNSLKSWCIGYFTNKWTVSNVIEKALGFVKKEAIERDFNKIMFLNKTFCAPSWQGSNCEVNAHKSCSANSDECFYNEQTGVLSVSCNRWYDAQKWHKQKTIPKIDNRALAKSFNDYEILPKDLEHVIVIGVSSVEHLPDIVKSRKVSSLTLLEPITFHYLLHNVNKSYKIDGFKSVPTTILSMPIEKFKTSRKFNTLIMMNAMESAYDALAILHTAIHLMTENGLIIWHDEIWDNYRGYVSSDNDFEFRSHPVRIKSIIADQFMVMFDPLFVSWEKEKDGQTNKAVSHIGRKRNVRTITRLPEHTPCFNRTNGEQTIVFFISKLNYTLLHEQIKMADQSTNTKQIIMIQTDEMESKDISKLYSHYEKIQIIVSSQHLKNWREEISYYTNPCSDIFRFLTSQMLSSSKTICIGNNGLTVVLMGYSRRRLKNYDIILPKYAKMKIIDQIILIWNNKDVPFSIKSKVNITFIKSAENTMNNRFDVSRYLRTDAVVMIDDDVLISEYLLHKLLIQWANDTYRLIGLDGRFLTKNNEYKFHGNGQPSLVIGKTMFFHRKYLDEYMKDKTLVEWNKYRFCEDISMNALIFKATNQKPIVVQMDKHYSRETLPDTDGLSIKEPTNVWLGRRSDCIRWASDYFKINMY